MSLAALVIVSVSTIETGSPDITSPTVLERRSLFGAALRPLVAARDVLDDARRGERVVRPRVPVVRRELAWVRDRAVDLERVAGLRRAVAFLAFVRPRAVVVRERPPFVLALATLHLLRLGIPNPGYPAAAGAKRRDR